MLWPVVGRDVGNSVKIWLETVVNAEVKSWGAKGRKSGTAIPSENAPLEASIAAWVPLLREQRMKARPSIDRYREK